METKSIIEKLRKETELTVELGNEGVSFTKEALEGVGAKWLEDVSLLFTWQHDGWKPGVVYPCCYKLPLGTPSKVLYSATSPYLVRKEDSALILEKNGQFVTSIEFINRPKLYSMVDSDGVPMRSTMQWEASSGVGYCIKSDCIYWKRDLQCAFCNTSASTDKRKQDAGIMEPKPYQIGEGAAMGIACGCNSIACSCGTRPEKWLVDRFIASLDSIEEHTGMSGICVINLPALKNLENIDRLYEAGARALVIDQEVWDEDQFKALCPGKAETIGRDNWMRAIEYAAKYTKPEKGICFVLNALVLGPEQKSKYIEAVEYWADRNVPVLLAPWKVLPGSNLYGHRAPYTWWTMEVHDECMEIQFKKMPWLLTKEFWQHTPHFCYNSARSVIWWDWIRRGLIEKGIITVEDQQIQDWQLAGVPWDHIQNVLTAKGIITEKDGHVRDWPKATSVPEPFEAEAAEV